MNLLINLSMENYKVLNIFITHDDRMLLVVLRYKIGILFMQISLNWIALI